MHVRGIKNIWQLVDILGLNICHKNPGTGFGGY
jgi:hypothetical protein